MRPEFAGATSATVNVVQQVGGSLGTALLSTVATSATLATLNLGQSASLDTATGLGPTWAMAIFAAGALLTFVVLPKGAPEQSNESSPESEREARRRMRGAR